MGTSSIGWEWACATNPGIKIQDSKSLAGDLDSLNEMSRTVILSLDIRSYGGMIEKNKEKNHCLSESRLAHVLKPAIPYV